MSNELDVPRLIEEVKAHPIIWDNRYGEYKHRTTTPYQWQEIAAVLGVDVDQCKRKWTNLRDSYRAEVRRTERRIERLKAAGTYNNPVTVRSKWAYFEAMGFINGCRLRKKRRTHRSEGEGSKGSRDADADGEADDDPPPGFHSVCDIKFETHHNTDEDQYEEDDRLLEEFVNTAAPQAESNPISIENAAEDAATLAAAAAETVAEAKADGSTQARCNANCKCSINRADDQVHFLEDLKREVQSLMQSAHMDIRRDNIASHLGDSNFNFLVSFLPQIKQMSELENLQFRVKMSELVFNIISSSQPTASGSSAITKKLETTATETATATPTASGTQLPQQQQPQQSLPRLTHQQMPHIELSKTGDLMDARNELPEGEEFVIGHK